eukprot:1160725-Pelagomonas_calceolata.AAC.2
MAIHCAQAQQQGCWTKIHLLFRHKEGLPISSKIRFSCLSWLPSPGQPATKKKTLAREAASQSAGVAGGHPCCKCQNTWME